MVDSYITQRPTDSKNSLLQKGTEKRKRELESSSFTPPLHYRKPPSSTTHKPNLHSSSNTTFCQKITINTSAVKQPTSPKLLPKPPRNPPLISPSHSQYHLLQQQISLRPPLSSSTPLHHKLNTLLKLPTIVHKTLLTTISPFIHAYLSILHVKTKPPQNLMRKNGSSNSSLDQYAYWSCSYGLQWVCKEMRKSSELGAFMTHCRLLQICSMLSFIILQTSTKTHDC